MEAKNPVDIPTVLIAIVIAKKGNTFLCTHEHDGWYLPAGRVDFGESFTTGALRECLEETEVPVTLQGIYKLQHTPGLRSTRMRAIFAATPIDDTPPKSVSNEEIIEAKWLTIDEVMKIPQDKLRSPELVSLLQFAASNPPIHPLDMLDPRDGTFISHIQYKADMIYWATFIVEDKGKMLFALSKDSLQLHTVIMPPGMQFKGATRLLKGIPHELLGILYLEHIAPPSQSVPGEMRVTFVAKGNTSKEYPENFVWVDFKEWKYLKLSERDSKLLQQYENGKMAPVSIIAMEYEAL